MVDGSNHHSHRRRSHRGGRISISKDNTNDGDHDTGDVMTNSIGKYRLLYSSFNKCLLYLSRIKRDAEERKTGGGAGGGSEATAAPASSSSSRSGGGGNRANGSASASARSTNHASQTTEQVAPPEAKHPFHGNSSLKHFFARAREMKGQSGSESGSDKGCYEKAESFVDDKKVSSFLFG